MSYEDLLNAMVGSAEGVIQLDPAVLKRDKDSLQKRIQRMGKGLVNPRSKFMQYWDFVTLSALLFTATVTPYEVCLLWDDATFNELWTTKPGLGTLFVINWIVNIVFIVDMGVCQCVEFL